MTNRKATRVSARMVVLLASLLVLESPWGQSIDGVDFQDRSRMRAPQWQERALGLLAAVDSRDDERLAELLEQHFTEGYAERQTLAAHASAFRIARWRLGAPALRGERIWPRSDERFFPLVQDDTSGIWWQLDVAIDPADEWRISSFSYTPITAPGFAEEPALESSDVAALSAELIGRLCRQERFSGAILVAQRDDILVSEACGNADKTFSVPNRADTRFNLASVNKLFTAIAVMQLVERGEIALSDTLDAHLDASWLEPDVAKSITVAQLLAHRAGLGNYMTSPEYRDASASLLSVEAHKAIVKREQLAFAPGDRFQYSNTGFVVLGALIEAVTGDDYYDVIRRQIYEPAGMTSSDSYPFNAVVPDVAEPYVRAPERATSFDKSLFFARIGRGTPAGGGYSTVFDLHRFAVALLARRYVADETLAVMWNDQTGFGINFYGYGLGLEVRQGVNRLAVGHTGSAPGASTSLEVFPESGYILIVLSNYGNAAVPVARRLSDFVARLVADARAREQAH